MRNASLTFCIRALMFSSVLPRYLKESVSSSGSPPSVTGLLFFVLAFMILVLLLLMFSPFCVDTVFRKSVFFPISVGQESEVICKIQVLQLAPRHPLYTIFLFYVVFIIIQSMASRKRKGDRRHPCLTHVFTINQCVVCPA